MRKCVRAMVFLYSLLLIGGGCTHSSNVMKKEPDAEVMHQTLTIRPGGSSEECIELKPGMVFDYDFDASNFVNFNIHYHVEDEVKYPVSNKGVKYGKGNVDPHTLEYYTADQDYYCLMWDNPNEEKVKVSFTCVVKNK